MEAIQNGIQIPGQFNFSKPEKWSKWKRRFERYRIVTGLDKKTKTEQINMLIYCVGDQADDTFPTLKIEDKERENYDSVMGSYEVHFIVKRNTIYERARFNERKQREGESVDDFIMALYLLIEHCEFGALWDELLRNRIVVGIRDKKLSEHMQLDSGLDLKKAITMAKQSALVRKQQPLIQGSTESTQDYQVKGKRSSGQYSMKPRFKKDQRRDTPDSHKKNDRSKQCSYCGNEAHPRKDCPAAKAPCNQCEKKGHYAKVCRKPAQT